MSNETALVTQKGSAMSPRWRMAPGSLGEAMEMANLIAGSELCPKAYKGKPADCIVAYEYGASIGLSWMQALRNVAVINGIPSIYGDALPALIYGSGECERFHEYFEGEKGKEDYTAVCIMKRKGMPDEVKRTFSVADARKAGLWGKAGPWTNYSDRMLMFRARGFAGRDTFADKLSGLILAEEALDVPDHDAPTVTVVSEVVPPAVSAFDSLPEDTRVNLEKAFETLNMAGGARLAKINEYFGGDGVDPEAAATALLEWCRDEFAKRKTGKPRAARGNGNAKKPVDPPVAAAPAVVDPPVTAPAPVVTPPVAEGVVAVDVDGDLF